MKKFVAVLLTLLLVLPLAACGKKEAQTASISLAANPTTGYEWFAFQSSDLFEIESEYVADSADEELVGGGGHYNFTLKPLKAGDCKVSFVYQRSWEAMELGDDLTYEITVTKDLQIKVNAMSGGIEGTEDELPEIPELTIS